MVPRQIFGRHFCRLFVGWDFVALGSATSSPRFDAWSKISGDCLNVLADFTTAANDTVGGVGVYISPWIWWPRFVSLGWGISCRTYCRRTTVPSCGQEGTTSGGLLTK